MTTYKNKKNILLAVTLLMLPSAAVAAWQAPGATAQEMAAAQITPMNGVSAAVVSPTSSFFNITADDVARGVAEQLKLQAVEEKAEVTLAAGSPKVIYSADHPLKLVIHALQIDTQSHRWQAQANVISNGKTETVKPVSGTYMGMVDVPVVTRQLGRNDIIEASDLSTRAVANSQLRKETVTDAKDLIGKSPRAIISANRPIRLSEVNSPIVVKKGDSVQMTYTNPYMSIKASGVALQDGAKGETIRVKNDKSEKAVSGMIQGAGHVEVNPSSSL